MSKLEVRGGMLQGFNGRQRVFIQYRVLKAQGKEVMVGYVFGLGEEEQASMLFERNLGGDSMPGTYAQAHVIASITGEKYNTIIPLLRLGSYYPHRRSHSGVNESLADVFIVLSRGMTKEGCGPQVVKAELD